MKRKVNPSAVIILTVILFRVIVCLHTVCVCVCVCTCVHYIYLYLYMSIVSSVDEYDYTISERGPTYEYEEKVRTSSNTKYHMHFA